MNLDVMGLARKASKERVFGLPQSFSSFFFKFHASQANLWQERMRASRRGGYWGGKGRRLVGNVLTSPPIWGGDHAGRPFETSASMLHVKLREATSRAASSQLREIIKCHVFVYFLSTSNESSTLFYN